MEMENLTTAIRRLRAAGYEADFVAIADGGLRCNACGAVCEPEDATVDEVVRFEGQSDPGDAAILVALSCDCGHRGLFTSSYGVEASPEAAQAMRRLATDD